MLLLTIPQMIWTFFDMLEDLKSSAVAFVYAWAIILAPIALVTTITSLVSVSYTHLTLPTILLV